MQKYIINSLIILGKIVGIMLVAVGLAGIPDNIKRWKDVITIINQNSTRWIFCIVGTIIIFVCFGLHKKLWQHSSPSSKGQSPEEETDADKSEEESNPDKKRKQAVKESLLKLTSGEWAGLEEILIKEVMSQKQITDYLNERGHDKSTNFLQSVNSKIAILERNFAGNYIIKQDFKEIISSLKDDESFKGQLYPKLSITYKQEAHPWFQEQRSKSSDGQLYTYRIGLINQGLEKIHNVNVRLTTIEPCPPDFLAPPCYLKFMKKSYNTKTLNLKPTGTAKGGLFVDVFKYFCPSKGNTRDVRELSICYYKKRIVLKIPVQQYMVNIRVDSDNGGSISKSFGFNPKKDIKTMMEMVD